MITNIQYIIHDNHFLQSIIAGWKNVMTGVSSVSVELGRTFVYSILLRYLLIRIFILLSVIIGIYFINSTGGGGGGRRRRCAARSSRGSAGGLSSAVR